MDGPKWKAAQQVLGESQDAEIALATDAVLMRYPPRCPADGLDLLGAASDIERFPGEPDGTLTTGYMGRLNARWPTKKKAGSKQAIIDSLNAYGVADVLPLNDSDGTFAPGEWWTRVWLVLGPTMPWGPMLLGSWTLGDGTLGSTATVNEVKQVKLQVLKLKWAYAYPVRIILKFDTTELFGVDMVLGSWVLGSGTGTSSWRLGKLFGFDTYMPFTMGGYEV